MLKWGQHSHLRRNYEFLMTFHYFCMHKNRKWPNNENLKKIRSKKKLKTENLGKKELAATARQRLSNANKKPSKNPKKTLRRPRKFWKTLKKPSRGPLKPSKNPPRRHFYEFWLLNATKGGARALARAPPFRYAFYSQNPQKCLRGGFFEGFRGPREGFLRVFQNFWGRRRVFLGFFEGFLLALEKLSKRVFWGFSGKSWDPRVWRVMRSIRPETRVDAVQVEFSWNAAGYLTRPWTG